MHKLTHKLKELGPPTPRLRWAGVRRIIFSLVVLAYLGFLGFITIMMLLPDNWISAMRHFNFVNTGDTHNLVHELVFAFIVGTAAVGLASQLWKPKENFAGQLVALIVWIAMIVAATFTNNWVPQQLFIVFGGLTLLATILHPALLRQTASADAKALADKSDGQAGRGLFNWFSAARINRTLLVLVIIAALPLTVFALTNINLQLAGDGGAGLFGAHNPPAFHSSNDTRGATIDEAANHDQEHITVGHYRNMAVFSFIIILIGVLASFRPKVWSSTPRLRLEERLAAWIAGFLSILLGFTSVMLPDAESSLGTMWGLTATAWGVVFIVVAEFICHRDKKSQLA